MARQDDSSEEVVELRVERDELLSLAHFNEQTLENIRVAVEERQLRDAQSAHLLRDALSALKLTVGLLVRSADLPESDMRRVLRIDSMARRLTEELDAHFLDREEEASSESPPGP